MNVNRASKARQDDFSDARNHARRSNSAMPCNANLRGGSSFARLLMAINHRVPVLASAYQSLCTIFRGRLRADSF